MVEHIFSTALGSLIGSGVGITVAALIFNVYEAKQLEKKNAALKSQKNGR